MIRWQEVATFGDLQRWLEERDVSIGDISRSRSNAIADSGWIVGIEPNTPASLLVTKQGATEEDFFERPGRCSVVEGGDDLFKALGAAMKKVDELLGLGGAQA